VKVYDGSELLATLYVDQREDGSQWNLLGSYSFSGTGRVVIISESSECHTCADAVRFMPVGDSDDDGLSDDLEEGMCTDSNDGDSDDDGIPDGMEDVNHNGLLDSGETDPCNIDTDGDGIQDGTELGYSMEDIGPDTDLSVFQPDLDPQSTTDPLNRDSDGDSFSEGEEDLNHNGRVDTGEYDPMSPDAIVEDNGGPGSSFSGAWHVSSMPDYYGDSSLYSIEAGAVYTLEASVVGFNDVSVWWTAHSGRCVAVPVKVYDGSELLATLYVDHREDGGQWNLLGSYSFSGTGRVVIISESSECHTCADAVRFVLADE